jgi:site-specific recombinase XerD
MKSFKHTFSVLAFLRTSRSVNKGKSPIYIRITVDGHRSEISTKQYSDPEKWNSSRGRLKGNSEYVRTINHSLETWEKKVKQHYNDLLEKNKFVSATILKNLTIGLSERENTFIAFFEKHTLEAKALVGIEFAKGTARNYEATLKHLKTYLPQAYKRADLLIKELDYKFITGFEKFLKVNCKNSQNGALKHIQRVKKVTNLAIKLGYLENDPFASYKATKEKVNRDYLSEDELKVIESVELESDRLQTARDFFVFICYTGLSYSDLADLKPANLRIGLDGDLWLFTERNKTTTASNIPLLPPARKILNKYQNHPEAINKGRLLPVISNQKLNKYLKEISKECKINKNISCHIGRHTFATTITLCNDIPIETVSKMLGHTSLRTTQIYAKVIEKKVSKDMQKLKLLYK